MEEPLHKINYDDENFRKLISDFDALNTFSAVSSWDSEAQMEIDRIIAVVRDLDTEITRQTQTLEILKQSKSEKSFMGRLFSSDKEEKELLLLIDEYNQYKVTLGNMASQLQESIDFTPNSPEEQKILIKELRQRKRELQIQKREVAAAMKAVRADARQQSAEAGRVFGLFYDSKMAAFQRRNIRYSKEASLRPHEDAKSAIERQVVQIDRDILWAEKFKE